MYTCIPSVQLLLAQLKAYQIKHVVMSPGGSDVPIIHSIEADSFFTCYSVFDERSAVYFAIGISQVLAQPVACVCTSGTAVANYLPGITEAYYQDVPIIAITADKNPLFNNQIETQKITQCGLFGERVRCSVELPVIHTQEEYWYCERLISEALYHSQTPGTGPVHINIPILDPFTTYDVSVLPAAKKINHVGLESGDDVWAAYARQLEQAKRILVVVGQNVDFLDEDVHNIERFFQRYNCVISAENIANLHCKGALNTYPVTEAIGGEVLEALHPDLVISLGNNVASYGLKPFLRSHCKEFRHWSIDPAGRIRDVFKGLSEVFQCTPSRFFAYFGADGVPGSENDMNYFTQWQKAVQSLKLPDFEFSNYFVARELAKRIPPQSLLHMAILNSTRVMQYFALNETVRCYSNVGALGIDGCLSTFIGQAAVTQGLAYCIIGDLSFFYDMGAAAIRHLGKNVRIIILNNGGGAEFHFSFGKDKVPTLNEYICAEHQVKAQGWLESLGFRYFAAATKEQVIQALDQFVAPSDAPMVLEVITDLERDGTITKAFYTANFSGRKPDFLKRTIKSVIPGRQLGKMKRIINAFQS